MRVVQRAGHCKATGSTALRAAFVQRLLSALHACVPSHATEKISILWGRREGGDVRRQASDLIYKCISVLIKAQRHILTQK